MTHDVDPYTVVAGIPAKEIGRRFASDLAQVLIDSRWWELSHEELLKSDFLFNPSDLASKVANGISDDLSQDASFIGAKVGK